MNSKTNEALDFSTLCTMFEEVKVSQNKQLALIEELRLMSASSSAVSAPTLDPEDGAKIEVLTQKLDSVSEQLDRPLRHHHTLDFSGNWALIALAAAIVGLIVSLWVIRNQRDTMVQFRDNDLKYRYIQMRGAATAADVLELRDIFDFHRNPDAIKSIRRQVERYEKLVQEQAENEARARFNDEQAKQLKQEAETVKKAR